MTPREIWAIGDIQGCCVALDELLAHPEIKNTPHPEFWFAGDMVNRGAESLRTIRQIMALGDQAVCVLGNHDIHLLAVYAGIRELSRTDTLDDILQAPDVDDIITWLRHQPLAYYAQGHLMVHAGVMSRWSLEDAIRLSNEVSGLLKSADWKKHLKKMFGNEPTQWKESLTGAKRLRVIVNGFTRMRMCNLKGAMDFNHKESPSASVRGDLVPWFDVPGRLTAYEKIIFGHWSTLGFMHTRHLIALDTGCVWGGKLSAIRLSDNKLVQIACYKK